MSGGSDRNVGRVRCSAEREEVSQVRGRVRLKEAQLPRWSGDWFSEPVVAMKGSPFNTVTLLKGPTVANQVML